MTTGITDILASIAALAAVFGSLVFVFVYRGWMRAIRQTPNRGDGRAVSVIVAAHDEEERIGALLEALCAQEYPKESFEVVVVDDRSADGSSEIILRYSDRLDLRLLRVDETPGGVSPKKFALHLGVGAARHDTMLMTDADCVPRPSWIRGMTDAFIRGADAVIGLAPLGTDTSAMSSAAAYAAYESRRTAAMAVSAAASGLPYMASGRSWGFTRRAYDRCGGLPALYGHLGGDDDLLLQRMASQGAKVGVCTRQDAIVDSPALTTWAALFRQKQRHYRVSAAYRGRAALLLGLFVGSQLLLPPLVIALGVLLPGPERVLPLLFWLWKLWYDTGFLVHACKWMNGDTRRFPLAFREGMHIFFSSLTGFTSYVKPPRWK